MIRALMWKEYREHRVIWLTLAVVGGGSLFGLSRLLGPEGFFSNNGARESLQLAAVLFAWTYGLVCGALLLANEREADTLTFLDMLPARRLQLWLVKMLFGLLLLLAQAAVLTGFVVGLGIAENIKEVLATLLAMLLFGLISLCWSLLFSARCDNVLNVIGFSFLGQIAGVLAASLLLVPASAVLAIIGVRIETLSKLVLGSLGVFALTVGPALGSARLFTRLDRNRLVGGPASLAAGLGAIRPAASAAASPGAWTSWGRLLWLSCVQMRRFAVGLTIFSLMLGFALPLLGPAVWPALTLLLGVLCGVSVWSDEQPSASFRFLGDQRFPLGRVWIVKVGTRSALAVFAASLLLLPSLVLTAMSQVKMQEQAVRNPFSAPDSSPLSADIFHSSLIGPVVPLGMHLSMWLLYGLTAGQLCGLLFRKSLVAGVTALSSAGMLACLWVPSLVGIGLHFWQVAGVPLALLAAGWLLVPAWAADRLLARGTFVRLGAVLLAAALWTAGGLWYRVAEVPDLPAAFDMTAFVAGIPSMDRGKNDAGLELHSAWHGVEQLAKSLNRDRRGKPLFPDRPETNTFPLEIQTALAEGWPNRPSELGDVLDAQFNERYPQFQEWYGHLAKAADCPLGVVEDAKLLTVDTPIGGQWHHVVFLNQILAVRGLQMQARGDPRTFVEHLRIGLALSRHVQDHAPPQVARAGRQAERVCVEALDRWLEKLVGHPELLERVRDLLLQHEAQLPDKNDVLKTAYLIARNTLEESSYKLVEREISEQRSQPSRAVELQKAEVDLVNLLWRIPWERQRHQRILRVIFEGNPNDLRQRRQVKKWGGSALSSLDLAARRLGPRSKRDTALLRAAQLKTAVRLYQTVNGKLPATLVDLVPHYLPAVPADPFDGRPFRYRQSRGAAGAVLWSVGEDGRDNGGIRSQLASAGEDLLYLVPPLR